MLFKDDRNCQSSLNSQDWNRAKINIMWNYISCFYRMHSLLAMTLTTQVLSGVSALFLKIR